jgi:outer membrane protease
MMKSIHRFAFFVSICVGAIIPVASHGQDSLDFAIARTPYRISLAATAGALIGQAEEIVYYADRDDMMSQLLWDLKPMVYAGSALSFSRSDPLAGPGVMVDMSVKFGLPLQTGAMKDRDWLKPSDPDVLTNFSTHDAFLEGGALLFDFAGGIGIPIKSAVALEALFAVSYMHFSWAGKNGYGKYLEHNWEKEPMKGTVITYDQAWMILSPGLGLFWPLHRALSLDFRFFFSPLIYAGAEDHHIGRKDRFNDYMRGGLCLEPSLDIAFAPNRFFSLVAHGSWRYIAGTRGDSFMNGALSTEVEAGAGFSAFDAGLSFKFALPLGLLGNKNLVYN